jgi:hypothetical protein
MGTDALRAHQVQFLRCIVPVSEISEDDLHADRSDVALIRVQALMLYPDDAVARLRAEDAFRTRLLSEYFASVPPDMNLGFKTVELKMLVQFAAAAPNALEVLAEEDLKRRAREGQIASGILFFVLGRHKTGRLASLKKTKTMMAKTFGVSMSTVEAAWARYKSVATLITAQMIGNAQSSTSLETLLACSEYLRREAESFVPKQSSKGAILQPGEGFSVAPEIQLPDYEITFKKPS